MNNPKNILPGQRWLFNDNNQIIIVRIIKYYDQYCIDGIVDYITENNYSSYEGNYIGKQEKDWTIEHNPFWKLLSNQDKSL